ncbi:LysR family transcriptional regulator [Amycolatopsis rhabdoformis]|uniref:LysR family transcriptional regulator n=1 Tax=Amycolatopsis rhabdoformis TaxID=1448059 RepID=A0ABZ1HYI9_9PSEU|nr:LysR family transcriptional regulator [Amycolatopsis rhabdoformis]WSE26449.1 LysR family transcriptional regulator [Amycolatopsis rhabdoformis]
MTTLQQLKVLLAVADHGGFTAAGERLGMAQPAVSRSVAALETELGAPLLTRQRTGVALTEAGERAVRRAREAVRQVDLLRAEVAEVAGQITGTLRIASLPTATGTRLPAELRLFTERHPLVAVRLIEGVDQEVRDWLDLGVVDAAVVTLPAPGLRTVLLDTHEMCAVLPVGHRLAEKDAVSYAELEEEPFVRPTGGCAQVFSAAAEQVGVRLEATFEAREMSAVLEMVRARLGVSILPSVGVPRLDGTVLRPLVPRTERRVAVAVSASASPAARAFLAQLEDGVVSD